MAPEVAVIVVGPGLTPIATPFTSIVATDVLLLFQTTEIAVAVLIPKTVTGVVNPHRLPFPSWPEPFHPQHCTVPPDKSAQVCPPPAEIAVAVLIPKTVTGMVE
jgi:hypothetical protein